MLKIPNILLCTYYLDRCTKNVYEAKWKCEA